MDIHDIDLDALLGAASKATKGSWAAGTTNLEIKGTSWHCVGTPTYPQIITGQIADVQSRADALYLEAARPEVVTTLVETVKSQAEALRYQEPADEETVLISNRVGRRGSSENKMYTVLTKRWVLPVLLALSNGQPLGNGALRERLPGISTMSLENALNVLLGLGLETHSYPRAGRYGAVHRITERGSEVVEAVRGLFNWIDANAELVTDDRSGAYDNLPPA